MALVAALRQQQVLMEADAVVQQQRQQQLEADLFESQTQVAEQAMSTRAASDAFHARVEQVEREALSLQQQGKDLRGLLAAAEDARTDVQHKLDTASSERDQLQVAMQEAMGLYNSVCQDAGTDRAQLALMKGQLEEQQRRSVRMEAAAALQQARQERLEPALARSQAQVAKQAMSTRAASDAFDARVEQMEREASSLEQQVVELRGLLDTAVSERDQLEGVMQGALHHYRAACQQRDQAISERDSASSERDQVQASEQLLQGLVERMAVERAEQETARVQLEQQQRDLLLVPEFPGVPLENQADLDITGELGRGAYGAVKRVQSKERAMKHYIVSTTPAGTRDRLQPFLRMLSPLHCRSLSHACLAPTLSLPAAPHGPQPH